LIVFAGFYPRKNIHEVIPLVELFAKRQIGNQEIIKIEKIDEFLKQKNAPQNCEVDVLTIFVK